MSLLSDSPVANSLVPTSRPPSCKIEDKSLEPGFRDPYGGPQWATLVLAHCSPQPPSIFHEASAHLACRTRPSPAFTMHVLHHGPALILSSNIWIYLSFYFPTHTISQPPHHRVSEGKNWGYLSLQSLGSVTTSCWTLCDPIDCNPLGSSVHGFPRREQWSGLLFPSPEAIPWVLRIVS